MGIARGNAGRGGRDRARGRGGINKPKGRGNIMKPPSLLAMGMPSPVRNRLHVGVPMGGLPPPRRMPVPLIAPFHHRPMRPSRPGYPYEFDQIHHSPYPRPMPAPIQTRMPHPPPFHGPMVPPAMIPPPRPVLQPHVGRGRIGFGVHPRPSFKQKRGGGKVTRNQNSGAKAISDFNLNNPWITNAIKEEIIKRNNLHQSAKKSGAASDWNEFKLQSSRVKSIVEAAKMEYIGRHPEQVEQFFNCESCDRCFKTETDLSVHLSEHEVCGREGCKFSAHPKIMIKHVQNIHQTGLYHRVANVYTEEEIAKWISLRKSNYPTRLNIERKQAEYEEKIQRGELLENKDMNHRREKFGSFKDKRRQFHRKRKFHDHEETSINADDKEKDGNKDNSSWTPPKKRPLQMKADAIQEIEHNFLGTLVPFPGTIIAMASLKSEENKVEERKIMESENVNKISELKDKSSDGSCNLEGNGVSSHFLTEEEKADDQNIEEEGQSKKINPEPISENAEKVMKEENGTSCNSIPSTCQPLVDYEIDDDSGPEEASTVKETAALEPSEVKESEDQNAPNKRRKRFRGRNKNKQNNSDDLSNEGRNKPNRPMQNTQTRLQRKRNSTLLEKLLAKEIRHERNVILQCIRHVVQSKFFGIS